MLLSILSCGAAVWNQKYNSKTSFLDSPEELNSSSSITKYSHGLNMLTSKAAPSWLHHRGRRRCIILVLLSPILLPFFYIAKLFCRAKDDHDADRMRACEEGLCRCEREEEDQVGLLQRYLEDQLMLVGSVYECGGSDNDDDGCERPLLR